MDLVQQCPRILNVLQLKLNEHQALVFALSTLSVDMTHEGKLKRQVLTEQTGLTNTEMTPIVPMYVQCSTVFEGLLPLSVGEYLCDLHGARPNGFQSVVKFLKGLSPTAY